MNKIKIYSKYDTPPRVPCPLESGSNVDKDSGKFTDINFIVKRYVDTGGASGLPARPDYNTPIYGDFSKSFTLSDAFALRDNMQVLFDELSPDEKSKYSDFNDFLYKVGSADDDEFVKMFTNVDCSTSTVGSPVTAPDVSGAEASGSVQPSPDSLAPNSEI